MLSKERQGEIALAILKAKMRSEGIPVGAHLQRTLTERAEELKIPPREFIQFIELLTRELVEETFKK